MICEVMSEDGTMLSGSDLSSYCKKHKLKVSSVEAVKEFKLNKEILLSRVAEANISDFSDIGLFSEEAGFPSEFPKRLI